MKTILLVLSAGAVLWGSVIFIRDTTRDTSRVPLMDSATQVRTQYRSIRQLYKDTTRLMASDTVKIIKVDTLKPHTVIKAKKVK
jgi:hypothetical protein